ncbi:hypothetical protein BO85DRAFT_520329, partial [Aspergillus piperis CBS 112811]
LLLLRGWHRLRFTHTLWSLLGAAKLLPYRPHHSTPASAPVTLFGFCNKRCIPPLPKPILPAHCSRPGPKL